MGFKDITEGDKIAKATAMRLIESKNGKYAMEVEFVFQEKKSDTPERLSWQGWLSEAALDRTMKTLVEVLGYNGSEKTDGAGIFVDPNVLDFNREVKLVVELEQSRDADNELKFDDKGNAVIFPKIKWVNSLGGSGYAGVAVEKVKTAFAAVGFKSAFLAAKKSAGPGATAPKKTEAKTEETAPPEEGLSDEEIPF